MKQVKPWWLNGAGEPTLYKMSVTWKSGQEKSVRMFRVGFRTVELVQNPVQNGK